MDNFFTGNQGNIKDLLNKPNFQLIKQDIEVPYQESIDEISDDSGWAFLGTLGSFIIKKKTDFDPRNYGYPKLFPLIKSTGLFKIEEKDTGEKNIRHIYVKNK